MEVLPVDDPVMFSNLTRGRKIVALILFFVIMQIVAWAAWNLFKVWLPRPYSWILGAIVGIGAIGGHLISTIARRRRANVHLQGVLLPRRQEERHRATSNRRHYLVDARLDR